jgi:ferredoxin
VSEPARPPALVLCRHLVEASVLDAAELAADLGGRWAAVEVLADLCRTPELLAGVVTRSGADRLVVGLCAPPAAPHDFQAQARKAGLDPFAVALLDLSRAGAAALPLLHAAAARLRAFPGSRPEQLKLRLLSLEDRRSRRSLFTLPPSTYEPVASVAETLCLGEGRCGLCLAACPVGALAPVGGKAAVDRDACVACGLCVALCPEGAIGLPGASLPELEAELAALLAVDSPRILFRCRRAGDDDASSATSWLPLAVPCLGMVGAGWILQALAGGARAVALHGCGEGCHGGRAREVEAAVDYCRRLLSLLGDGAAEERVLLACPAAPPALPPLERAEDGAPITLREPAASVQALSRLASKKRSAVEEALLHEASPLGLVEVREETCTACGACSAVCPTGALVLDEGGEETVLSLDPRLCIGCGRCVPVCPEQDHDTLVLRRGTDLAALAEGRVVLKRAASARCRRCGAPIAPSAMLERVRGLLADEGEAEELLRVVGELCADCRGLS